MKFKPLLTADIRKKQSVGDFSYGNDRAETRVLLIGSCRFLLPLNYLLAFNHFNPGGLGIWYIDPVGLQFDESGRQVDLVENCKKWEKDERLLSVLEKPNVFIHEHFEHFGVFNTFDKSGGIYDAGLKPSLDISVPNFHAKFVFFNEILKYYTDLKERAVREMADTGTLSDSLIEIVRGTGLQWLRQFADLCKLTDFPWFGEYLLDNMIDHRMFWSCSHVTKNYNRPIWLDIMQKSLGLTLGQDWTDSTEPMELFAPGVTLTKYDVIAHGWKWASDLGELDLS